MSAHQCAESDREFIQFYHRRVAWLALRRHDQAIQDADHTLALMDFVRRQGTEKITSRRTSSSGASSCSTAPRPQLHWRSNGIGLKRPSMPCATGSSA